MYVETCVRLFLGLSIVSLHPIKDTVLLSRIFLGPRHENLLPLKTGNSCRNINYENMLNKLKKYNTMILPALCSYHRPSWKEHAIIILPSARRTGGPVELFFRQEDHGTIVRSYGASSPTGIYVEGLLASEIH